MYPNSSISASDARRYVIAMVVTALVTVIAIMALSFLGVRDGWSGWREISIVQLQRQRLAQAENFDILMVGDSSLAQAVDTRQWSAGLGQRVLALPLVGTYGYEGSLNMIRRAFRVHKPKTVIVFQTPDMMTRKISWAGVLFTAETWGDLAGMPPWKAVKPLANWDIPASMIRYGVLKQRIDEENARLEFPPQNARNFNQRFNREQMTPEKFRPEKATYLFAIGKFCAQEQVRCLYVHGPYVQPECGSAGAYLAKFHAVILQAGLIPVEGSPICLTRDQAGDAADHVHPRLKSDFSQRYLDLVKRALGQ